MNMNHTNTNANKPATIGRLLVIPTPLDFGCAPELIAPIAQVLPEHTIAAAAATTHWISENAKSTRAFLSRVHAHTPLACAMQDMHIQVLPRDAHKSGDHQVSALDTQAKAWLAPALQGFDVALVSEAGMPAIADPGSSVVRAAHAMGLAVVPLSGPVSLMLALAASGLNGQQFAFVGYLKKGAELSAHIKSLEATALKTGQTQICIETPYRNAQLLQALITTLSPNTRLAVACGLAVDAQVISQTVAQWRDKAKQGLPSFDLPAVFLWGA
jgi:16S rRNA (cytidine1402-2'-O)-methyltransferase